MPAVPEPVPVPVRVGRKGLRVGVARPASACTCTHMHALDQLTSLACTPHMHALVYLASTLHMHDLFTIITTAMMTHGYLRDVFAMATRALTTQAHASMGVHANVATSMCRHC